MNSGLFDVKDSVVLVSGGSRGIGLAIARAFSKQDAKVIVTGRNEETLREACEAERKSGYSLDFEVCDVGNVEEINKCIEQVVLRYGRIDTLINCAGINKKDPAEVVTVNTFDQIMEINLRGAFFMAQSVGKQMIAQKCGNIVNIDSLTSYAPPNYIVPYSMSKSGMSSMTRGLAHEWGQHGIRVNGLAPGFILTDLNRDLWANDNMQAWNQAVTPLGRLGTPDDLVATAIFLASSGASFLTGQTIRVDGGISAGIAWPIANDFKVSIE